MNKLRPPISSELDAFDPCSDADYSYDYATWFRETDPEPGNLLHALDKLPDPKPLKLQAIRNLLRIALGHRLSAQEMQDIERAYEEQTTVDLHCFFLISWFRTMFFVQRDWKRMRVLRDQIVSLLSDEMPKEVRGWAMLAEALIAQHDGNISKTSRFLNEAVESCPPKSIHRRRLELIRMLNFLQMGIGKAVATPKDLSGVGKIFENRLRAMQVVNGSITGDLESVRNVPPIESAQPFMVFLSYEYSVACQTLGMMARYYGNTNILSRPWCVAASEISPTLWMQSTESLLLGCPDDAIASARRHVALKLEGSVVGFDAYTLIRAELATGHLDAARRLLSARRDRGARHFIDDFFWARAEWAAGDKELAGIYFANVLEVCKEYGAMRRLDFELALACEFDRIAVVRLTQEASRTRSSGRKKRISANNISFGSQKAAHGIKRLIHSSDTMAEICERIVNFSSHCAPVLITGETGTGKELVARALHEAGPRTHQPFVVINCASLPDALIESELFGYERGAFTGAQATKRGLFREAQKGTIFLDEIGDISNRLQLAFLRVLETNDVRSLGSPKTHPIDCRIVMATNAELADRVKEGKFRQDLFYRLQRLKIEIPPLRNRPHDIVVLARYFLNLERPSERTATISPALAARFKRYRWPGNVRELRNIIERLRVLNSEKLAYDVGDLHDRLVDLTEEAPRVDVGCQDPQSQELSRVDTEDSGTVGLTHIHDNVRPRFETRRGVDPHVEHAPQTEGQIAAYLGSQPSQLRRIFRLKELFQDHDQLKTNEISHILNVSRHTVSRDLKALVKEGFIEKVRPSKSPRTHYYRRL